jgi:hypothetical protein
MTHPLHVRALSLLLVATLTALAAPRPARAENVAPNYAQAPMPAPIYYPPPYLPQPRVHYETQPRWGLFVTGAVIFAATYMMTSLIGYAAGAGYYAVPVAGPLFYWDSSDTGSSRSANLGLLLVTGVQFVGVTMAVLGLALRKKVAVNDPLAQALSGRFYF